MLVPSAIILFMKRLALDHLKKWYQRSSRMPLVLRGARQVGKSTLVRLFAEQEKLDLIEINLERHKIKSADKESLNIQEIIDEIQLRTKKHITHQSLIFIDEIQEQPKLLMALRFFFEDRPDLAIVSAGSLLEIVLRDKNFSFPVGRVEFMHLGPMTFTEFLWATGNQILAEKIKRRDFSESVRSLATEEFRKFLYIGGMPQAVKTYVEEKSLVGVRHIQEQILQTYEADFPKYNDRIQLSRIQRIFLNSVVQLGKKVVYKRFDSESQSRDIRRILELLIDARVILPCLHTEGNSVPLAGESDESVFKIYFLDVGLMNCLLRLDLDFIDSEFKNNFNTKGVMAEQFVAQHLAYLEHPSLQPKLFYWLRDRGVQKSEVDFLIESKQQVIPVEVKATAAGHLKSLFSFINERNKKTAVRLSLAPYSVENISHKIHGKVVSGSLLSLPLWAVESIKEIELPSF